jgi:hypothetical protein
MGMMNVGRVLELKAVRKQANVREGSWESGIRSFLRRGENRLSAWSLSNSSSRNGIENASRSFLTRSQHSSGKEAPMTEQD